MKKKEQREAKRSAKEKNRIDTMLHAIENHSSCFSFIPDNIGKILWCDTTTPYAFPEERPGISQLIPFNGTDYFVGTDGFAEIRFKGSRSNITKKDVFCFESFSELVSIKTKIIINYSDQGTRWNFSFFEHPDKDKLAKIALEYKTKSDILTKDVAFLENAEWAWTRYRYMQIKKEYEESGSISFNGIFLVKGSVEKCAILPYVIVHNDNAPSMSYFEVNGKRFDSTNLKKVFYKTDGNLILCKKSDSIFHKIGLAKRDSIFLSCVGTPKLFLFCFKRALDDILSKKDIDLKGVLDANEDLGKIAKE